MSKFDGFSYRKVGTNRDSNLLQLETEVKRESDLSTPALFQFRSSNHSGSLNSNDSDLLACDHENLNSLLNEDEVNANESS
jgi:hypothetical protein